MNEPIRTELQFNIRLGAYMLCGGDIKRNLPPEFTEYIDWKRQSDLLCKGEEGEPKSSPRHHEMVVRSEGAEVTEPVATSLRFKNFKRRIYAQFTSNP